MHIPSDLLAMSQKYDHTTAFLGDKQYSCCYDMSKIKRDIDHFDHHISIEKGLAMYLKYMDAHPELKIKDDEYNEWCNHLIDIYHQVEKTVKDNL